MKKLLLSIMVLAAVVAGVVGATSAYFSDTETSTGNIFEAGRIDLQIDNSSWLNGVYNTETSWDLRNLTSELFFNFRDIKPGDWGEDTVSMHVDDNPSWVCANITLTQAAENGVGEPETSDGDSPVLIGPWDGELDNQLNWVFWADDGDNVLELGEGVLMQGPVSALPQGIPGMTYALADSQNNVFGDVPGTPYPESTTRYIAKAWCFGNLTLAPVVEDPGNHPNVNPGIVCDGSLVNNVAQSDDVMGNVSFYAVQTRHNDGFLCSSWNPNPGP